ncbi:PREDICTED: putative fatty acyl-CoA reductase CG5065 [Dinoponera quadriceps]|uniref:Fatty acyl-CoA reductase n=1 Tax=Dinoponera quadriceps TaxID=609295 RepID=A0A6P3XM86_DINQU|nr:PREDICTED: putative fatty acyl-CoA reductase CG5065 [Dinoponera quadriceps]
MDRMILKNKTYDDLLDISKPTDTSNCQSEISQYYRGRNILITGSSGFLGILLIERLLRCCPDIGKMYVLMREKKGKSVDERFNELFDNVVYDRMKKEQPDFIAKVIMIEADFGEADLGLSPENRKRLLDTNIIFHMAATVRFNEILRIAVNINVRGTKQMLLFAKEMPNLEAFVYVSTAFCHCVKSFIDEKYYPPPLEADKILTLINILDDDKLENIKPTLLGEWPNTYVYSKAIAEDLVRQYSVGLPACIIRPSIVVTTLKEPISGWTNNLYGAIGIVMGTCIGLLRTLHCVPEYIADMIPADYVIANIIVAGWDIAKRKDTLLSIEETDPDVPETERTPIYNCVSSPQNPITWKRFTSLNEKYGLQIPSTKMIWYYKFTLNRYRFMNEIYVIFLHFIPAVIVDVLAFLIGRKPMLVKSYKKLDKFINVVTYFTIRQWQFRNDAVLKLWSRLNLADRKMFNFNVQDLSWKEFTVNMVFGLRLYLLKDTEDTIEQARIRYRKMKIVHYTIITIVSILLMWGILSLANFVISFFS